MRQREELIETIDRQVARDNLYKSGIRPVVTLEDFFVDNEDVASIGCNLSDHPGVQRFYQILSDVRARDDVFDVLVGITEIVDRESDGCWPFSDEIYVITTAAPEMVNSWLKELQPDEAFPITPKRANLPESKAPYQTLVVWWD